MSISSCIESEIIFREIRTIHPDRGFTDRFGALRSYDSERLVNLSLLEVTVVTGVKVTRLFIFLLPGDTCLKTRACRALCTLKIP